MTATEPMKPASPSATASSDPFAIGSTGDLPSWEEMQKIKALKKKNMERQETKEDAEEEKASTSTEQKGCDEKDAKSSSVAAKAAAAAVRTSVASAQISSGEQNEHVLQTISDMVAVLSNLHEEKAVSFCTLARHQL